MKGVRFYEEFENKRKGVSEGNVIALFYDSWRHGSAEQGRLTDGIVSLYDTPNSPVCSGSVADSVLHAKCKRIPESKARAIHPALFERLDAEE